MKMKRFFVSCIGFIALMTSQNVHAQQEQSLIFMTDVWQSNLLNPALLPEKKYTIALPSVYFNLYSPDVTINDLVVTNSESGKRRLDLDTLLNSRLKESNHFDANVHLQTFGLTFPVSKKFSLTLSHGVFGDPSVTGRRDLLRLIVKGNAQFLAKTTAFGGTADGSVRSEFAIGGTYKLPMITVGARIKFLYGISAIFTPTGKLDIGFNPNDYSVRFINDFDIRTFDIDKLNNLNSIPDLLKNGGTSNNKGIGIDIGGTMKLGKIQLNASLLDVSSTIKWKSGGTSYSSKGDFTYTGMNAGGRDQFFRWDSLSSKSFRDTLKKLIAYKEVNSGVTYDQKLPTRLYLSGSYEVNSTLQVSAMFYSEIRPEESRTGFMLDATAKVLKVVRIGATFGLRNGGFDNLGGHISAKLGPVHLFAVTDNMLTIFKPYDAHKTNGRIGGSISF